VIRVNGTVGVRQQDDQQRVRSAREFDPEGTLEDHADHALGTFSTQPEAIDWTEKQITILLSLASAI
jgi:hypothetical protein